MNFVSPSLQANRSCMPPGVVGIDVDHYGTKRGLDTIAAVEAELGGR